MNQETNGPRAKPSAVPLHTAGAGVDETKAAHPIVARPFFGTEQLPWGYRERADAMTRDTRNRTFDLRAGVIRNSLGEIPLFDAVRQATARLPFERGEGYLRPTGLPEFRGLMQDLILGPDNSRAAVTVQTIGGSNALRQAADLLAGLKPSPTVFVSAESWADHERIFKQSGLQVQSYPYLDRSSGEIAVDDLIDRLSAAPRGSAVLLQASAHNPTGLDPSRVQWDRIFDIVSKRGLLPLIDIAYAGLAEGWNEDLWPVRRAAERGLDFLAATSCCKSFGLYSARVGALTAVVSSSEVAERLESRLKAGIQTSYSSPPRHGAALIATILGDPELRAAWQRELGEMRTDLALRRKLFAAALRDADAPSPLCDIEKQKGIFVWTGLDRAACRWLAEERGIFIPSNGRVCLAAIRSIDIPFVAESIAHAARRI